MAAICLDTGEWDKNPVGIVCRGKCILTLKCPHLNHAAIYIYMQLNPPIY